MREEIARHAYPVFSYGLRLRERLDRGERPDLQAELAALRGLLGSSNAPPPWGSGADMTASMAASRPEKFLGIRYALACWLDEVMIDDTPWGAAWNEQSLEPALFQTRLRYSKFWEQARLAESAAGSADALEAFLLCVLFGFRGEMGEQPYQLQEWVSTTRSRVAKGQGQPLPPVGEIPPEPNVPFLVWADRYQQMVKVCTISLLAMVPLVTFLLVSLFR
ncbi:MAG TPA: DotU family type IV/VI secretion system protein [Gemmataceae bacterium]